MTREKERLRHIIEAQNTLKAEIDRLKDKIRFTKSLSKCRQVERDFRNLEILDAERKISQYKDLIRSSKS